MQEADHVATYFRAVTDLAADVQGEQVDAMARGLAMVRERGGRLFLIGVGGGAGHASHAVNDFRKLCHIESYAPSDNVSELTARTNDEGWETSLRAWLKISRLARARCAVRLLRRRRLARAQRFDEPRQRDGVGQERRRSDSSGSPGRPEAPWPSWLTWRS